MKRRAISILLLVSCLIGGVVFLWKHSRQAVPLSLPPMSAVPAAAPPSNGVSAANPAAKPYARPPGVDNAGWKYLSTVREMMLSQNQPIEFYARVVDQDGNPVSGARLVLKLTKVDTEKVLAQFPHMNMGQEQVTETNSVYSDDKGWMQFVGTRGHYLYIWELSKDGYVSDVPPGNYDLLSYEPGGKRTVNRLVEMANAFDSKKGYTFHLWRKGAAERVIPITMGVNMDNESQGEWVSNYFVGFVSGKMQWTPFPGTDLIISGVRHLTGISDRPYEITFTLRVAQGGLVVADDAYPFHAPEAGYQPSWTFEDKPMTQGPEALPWTKTLYFKLRGGRMYAGARVSFHKAGFNIGFDGYLNPNGTPNLEPDPQKLITDPAEIQRLDEQTRVR